MLIQLYICMCVCIHMNHLYDKVLLIELLFWILTGPRLSPSVWASNNPLRSRHEDYWPNFKKINKNHIYLVKGYRKSLKLKWVLFLDYMNSVYIISSPLDYKFLEGQDYTFLTLIFSVPACYRQSKLLNLTINIDQ